MPTTKRRALIIISSARQLPLAEPVDVKSISTGFFLVEMAQVLKEFENDYEFTFATPDGNAPQLDINGMALSVQSIEKTGAKTIPLRIQQRRRSFDVNSFRQRHPELVARREQEVQLLERHIGRVPVSELLPNSEPELAKYRPELIRRLDKLPEGALHSLPELVGRHRDPADPFTFADFDFIHASGGIADQVQICIVRSGAGHDLVPVEGGEDGLLSILGRFVGFLGGFRGFRGGVCEGGRGYRSNGQQST